jgi:hypothetical protein
MFGSFGTPGNFAVRTYLNERQIPQLFVASGDDHLSDPSLFPWTMGWQPSIREEGRIYANYIQAFYSGKRIVALWQNDHFGRELFRGLQDGLGDIARMIKLDIAYDTDEQLGARIGPEALGRRDSCVRGRAGGSDQSDPKCCGTELAPCVHPESHVVVDCDGTEACRPGKSPGRHHGKLPEGCQ